MPNAIAKKEYSGMFDHCLEICSSNSKSLTLSATFYGSQDEFLQKYR